MHLRLLAAPRRLLSSALLGAVLAACGDGGGGSTGPEPAPPPVLAAISPDEAGVGDGGVLLTATGRGFQRTSAIRWNGTELSTTYVSETGLRAAVPAALLETGGQASVDVVTPEPGGGVSAARGFTVRYAAPTLASLSVDTATVGRAGVTVTVTGTGFAAATQVRWNGEARATTFLGPTQVSFALTGAEAAGGAQVTVANPQPGGGVSAAASFIVLNPVPAITLLPSAGATAGSGPFTLTLHGTGFVEGSEVEWNGARRETLFVDSTRLRVAVTAADVASPRTIGLRVTNPTPARYPARASGTAAFTVRALGAATFTVARVPVTGNDLAWDPGTGRFYVSVPPHGGFLANLVVAIDPVDARVTGTLGVGEQPTWLARSDDGRYLYVALYAAGSVRRVDLTSFRAGLEFLLPADEHAGDLEAVPGEPGSVAVARYRKGTTPPLSGVTIYDEGVARPASAPGHIGAERVEFAGGAAALFGYAADAFYTLSVRPDGVHQGPPGVGLVSGPYTDIVGVAGRIYSTRGEVVDAGRRARLGRFAVESGNVTADPATGRAFVANVDGIHVFDLNTFELLGTLAVPYSPYYFETGLVRWGSDGLAFLARDELVLVRSPLVAP
jgi:IPT/TIG domain